MLLGFGEYQQLTHRNLYPTAKSWVLGAVSHEEHGQARLLRASAAPTPARPTLRLPLLMGAQTLGAVQSTST